MQNSCQTLFTHNLSKAAAYYRIIIQETFFFLNGRRLVPRSPLVASQGLGLSLLRHVPTISIVILFGLVNQAIFENFRGSLALLFGKWRPTVQWNAAG